MTTTTQATSHGGGYGFWVLVVLAALVLLALAGLGGMSGVEYGDHAVERHGEDAIRARAINEQFGRRYDCRDDKTYWIGSSGNGKFAVTVVRGGKEATSFLTRSRNYIRNILRKDDCYPAN